MVPENTTLHGLWSQEIQLTMAYGPTTTLHDLWSQQTQLAMAYGPSKNNLSWPIVQLEV